MAKQSTDGTRCECCERHIVWKDGAKSTWSCWYCDTDNKTEWCCSKCTFTAPAGVVLFNKLNALFDSDPGIDELGIVITASPSFYLDDGSEDVYDPLAHPEYGPPFCLIEHKLGIGQWVIPLLIAFGLPRMHELRSLAPVQALVLHRNHSAPDKPAVTETRASKEVSPPRAEVDTSLWPDELVDALATELLRVTRLVLMINTDNYTAWNTRKGVLMYRRQKLPLDAAHPAARQLVLDEIVLLNLIFSKHPKCSDAWMHRRWALRLLPEFSEACFSSSSAFPYHTMPSASPSVSPSTHSPSSASPSCGASLYASAVFQGELLACSQAAELYPKNYFAWNHRKWLSAVIDQRPDLLAELEASKKWMDRHVSDHSGIQHRQVLMQQLLRISSAHSKLACPASQLVDNALRWRSKEAIQDCGECAVWRAELQHAAKLQEYYPGHESVWSFRRFLFLLRVCMLAQHPSHGGGGWESAVEAVALAEMGYAKACGDDCDSNNHVATRRFATMYNLWVIHVVWRVLVASGASMDILSRWSSRREAVLAEVEIVRPANKQLWDALSW